jgi:hypothetical protein
LDNFLPSAKPADCSIPFPLLRVTAMKVAGDKEGEGVKVMAMATRVAGK